MIAPGREMGERGKGTYVHQKQPQIWGRSNTTQDLQRDWAAREDELWVVRVQRSTGEARLRHDLAQAASARVSG